MKKIIKKVKLIIGVAKAVYKVNEKEDISLCIGEISKELLVFVGPTIANKGHYDYFVKKRPDKLKASVTSGRPTPLVSFIQEDYGEVVRFLMFARNLLLSQKTESIVKVKK